MNTFYQVPNWPLVTLENEKFFNLQQLFVNWLSTYLKKFDQSINLSLDNNYGFDTLFIEH